MPADVQQIIKSTRPASTSSKKSAAISGEDFGYFLKQAHKPRPKSVPETKESPVEQESIKPSTDELPTDETQATAEAPQETDNKTENNDLPGDHPEEHHETAGEDYAAAAQVVSPQPVAAMDKPPVVEQKPQPADPQMDAEVIALNQQSTQPIATQDGRPVLKTIPVPVSQTVLPTNPQPSADPAAQAGTQPTLKLGEPLDSSSDDSNSSSADRNKAQQANPLPNPNAMNAELAAAQSAVTSADPDHPAAAKPDLNTRLDMVIAPLGDSSTSKTAPTVANAATTPPPVAPEAQFAQANHANIVTALRSEIAGSNGTVHIRLDPPELGALQVTVRMRDGIMSAAFETSNDEATKLLSHSLTQLKQVLESQGVNIDKLHVQQSARSDKPTTGEEHQNQQNHRDGHSAQQEQQRKEMIRRMWRRLGVGADPLDLVA